MNRRRVIKSGAAAALLPSLPSQLFSAASAEDAAAKPPYRVSGPGTRRGLPQRAGTGSIVMSVAV
jgi:hypothetical protein